MSKDKNSRLVYSTETGRIKEDKPSIATPKGDGIVRLRRETAGRNGKGVTTISGVPLDEVKLKDLAKASDMQNITALTEPVIKHYWCWPEEEELRR